MHPEMGSPFPHQSNCGSSAWVTIQNSAESNAIGWLDSDGGDMAVYGAGGMVVRPKFSIGEFGWVTLCEDTGGNLFSLSSMQ